MKPVDLVQGTLDLLILTSLALEPRHGWAIARRIRQLSNDVLLVQQGSLYPALQRLEHQGRPEAARARIGVVGAARRRDHARGTNRVTTTSNARAATGATQDRVACRARPAVHVVVGNAA